MRGDILSRSLILLSFLSKNLSLSDMVYIFIYWTCIISSLSRRYRRTGIWWWVPEHLSTMPGANLVFHKYLFCEQKDKYAVSFPEDLAKGWSGFRALEEVRSVALFTRCASHTAVLSGAWAPAGYNEAFAGQNQASEMKSTWVYLHPCPLPHRHEQVIPASQSNNSQ